MRSEAALNSCNLSPDPPAPATHGICKATAHIKKPAAPGQRRGPDRFLVISLIPPPIPPPDLPHGSCTNDAPPAANCA